MFPPPRWRVCRVSNAWQPITCNLQTGPTLHMVELSEKAGLCLAFVSSFASDDGGNSGFVVDDQV